VYRKSSAFPCIKPIYKVLANFAIINVIGYLAAIIGTALMLPQVIKSIRTKSVQDLSWLMLTLYLFNCLLWAIYGFLIAAIPVVLCNIVALVISIVQIGVKWKYS